jgi:hypothetical protein
MQGTPCSSLAITSRAQPCLLLLAVAAGAGLAASLESELAESLMSCWQVMQARHQGLNCLGVTISRRRSSSSSSSNSSLLLALLLGQLRLPVPWVALLLLAQLLLLLLVAPRRQGQQRQQ